MPHVRGKVQISNTILVVLAMLVLLGCAAATPEQPPSPDRPRRLYLVSHGWHVGMVIPRGDIPAHLWPAHRELPASIYLEVGWGDQAFYQASKTTLALLLKAALRPTPSVLHLAWFNQPVSQYFPASDIVEVDVTQQGFEALARFMETTYDRDGQGKIAPLASGIYGTSRFYQARGKYHLFNTCNTWTAKALRAAGCQIAARGFLTAKQILARARSCGRLVRRFGGVRGRNVCYQTPPAQIPASGATALGSCLESYRQSAQSDSDDRCEPQGAISVHSAPCASS